MTSANRHFFFSFPTPPVCAFPLWAPQIQSQARPMISVPWMRWGFCVIYPRYKVDSEAMVRGVDSCQHRAISGPCNGEVPADPWRGYNVLI